MLSIQKWETASLPPLGEMVSESEKEFALLRRLVDDWESGANRFDRPGEALFVGQTREADAFYRAIGFAVRADHESATHVLKWNQGSGVRVT